VLLGTGLFDWPATRLTAAALALLVLSSLFQSLILLFMRGFYSAGFTKRPFFINLFSTALLGGVTYSLVKIFYASETFRFFVTSLMKVEDLPNSVVLMLPLGFSIGTIVNCFILWLAFEREFRGFSRGVMRSLFQGTGASIIMGATAYVGLNLFDTLFDLNTLLGIFLQGFFSGLLAIITGVVILLVLKSRELREVWEVLRGKFWKVQVIATDPEIV
jgi:peptidoglycan biosynthesis protein MviN/MurJ (putative lipid II flippase)